MLNLELIPYTFPPNLLSRIETLLYPNLFAPALLILLDVKERKPFSARFYLVDLFLYY